jgi:hypothetical protein
MDDARILRRCTNHVAPYLEQAIQLGATSRPDTEFNPAVRVAYQLQSKFLVTTFFGREKERVQS